MDLDYIKTKIHTISESQLLTDLLNGADGFRDGAYELYVEEVKKRGLDGSVLEAKMIIQNNKNVIDKQGTQLFKIGLLFLSTFFFLSIPSLIIGFVLHEKDGNGNYRHNTNIRSAAKILIGVPALFVIGVVITIVFAAAKF